MTPGIPGSQPILYVQQAVTAAAGLTTPPASATYAVLVPETNGIRYRDDGTNPTAAIGTPVAAGASVTYDGPLDKIKVIAQTGTSTLNVSYYVGRRT